MRHRSSARRPLLAALVLALAALLPAAPAAEAQDFSLNRRYDQYCYLTTHNAYANDEQDYNGLVANQEYSILKQLADGVRCLMLDTYLVRQRRDVIRTAELYTHSSQRPSSQFAGLPLEVVLAHNPDRWGYALLDGHPFSEPAFRKLRTELTGVKTWMALNPGEIVTLVLESHFTDPGMMLEEFEAADLDTMIFYADRPNPGFPAPDGTAWDVDLHGWPRVGQMADLNRRLVVFSGAGNQGNGEAHDGLPYQWHSMVESVYGDDSLNPATCASPVGPSYELSYQAKSLLFVNYFPTFNATGGAPFGNINSTARISACLDSIRRVAIRPPNFLAVDFYHKGATAHGTTYGSSGPPEVVEMLNRLVWPRVPAILGTYTLSSQAGTTGWHRRPVRVTLSGRTQAGQIQRLEYNLRGATVNSGIGTRYARLTLQNDGITKINWQVVGSLSNRSDVSTLVVRLDQQPPTTLATLTPALGLAWGGTPVRVRLEADEKGSSVASTWYRLDNGPAIRYTGPFVISEQGQHFLQYWSVDRAGNQEAARTSILRIDSVAPETRASLSPQPNGAGWRRTPVEVTLTATDRHSGVEKTWYRLDGGAPARYKYPFTVDADGPHTLSYWSEDAAGNQESQRSETFQIDATAPVVSVSAGRTRLWPANGKRTRITLSGRVAEAGSGVGSVTFSVGDEYGEVQPSGPITLEADGTFTCYVTLVASRRGSDANGRRYIVRVRAQDLAGNIGAASVAIIVPHDNSGNK